MCNLFDPTNGTKEVPRLQSTLLKHREAIPRLQGKRVYPTNKLWHLEIGAFQCSMPSLDPHNHGVSLNCWDFSSFPDQAEHDSPLIGAHRMNTLLRNQLLNKLSSGRHSVERVRGTKTLPRGKAFSKSASQKQINTAGQILGSLKCISEVNLIYSGWGFVVWILHHFDKTWLSNSLSHCWC